MKVLIAAPLRQEVKIFREYQAGLDRLIVPEGVTVDRYFVVNDCPEVIPEIRGAAYDVLDTGDRFQKSDNDHLWTLENLEKMPALRNMTVRRALEGGYDYLFSVDTDIILHPETLLRLLDADKDIVSELFWTNGWCNAWMYDQSSGMTTKWVIPGLYQVGMTGACTLIKREVLAQGVDFTPISNIRKALWGEDRWFCIRAAVLGFEMWIDTHCPPWHLYSEKEYQIFIDRPIKLY